jgi:excisionase family DNA binding protein
MPGHFMRVNEKAWTILKWIAQPLDDSPSQAILRLALMAGIESRPVKDPDGAVQFEITRKAVPFAPDPFSGGGANGSPVPQTLQTQMSAHQEVHQKSPARSEHRTSGDVRITPRLLSVSQAAVYLGRTRRAIEGLIARSDLQVVRLGHGRRIFLDRQELDRMIDGAK